MDTNDVPANWLVETEQIEQILNTYVIGMVNWLVTDEISKHKQPLGVTSTLGISVVMGVDFAYIIVLVLFLLSVTLILTVTHTSKVNVPTTH